MFGKARRYGLLITGLLWLGAPRLGWAQAQHLLSGLVRGADGGALPGASVAVPALSLGTATEADGHFSLALPEGPQQVVVSFVGYAPQTLSVNLHRAQQHNFTLTLATSELGEVVVGLKEARTSDEEITIFKSVGVALQDVAVAAAMFEIATRCNLGVPLDAFAPSLSLAEAHVLTHSV